MARQGKASGTELARAHVRERKMPQSSRIELGFILATSSKRCLKEFMAFIDF